MPCYRCGVRQTDPSRGSSPWRRGVRGDHLVLVCPACQAAVPDWAAELDRCDRCDGTHLIRRLGQVECLDCNWTRDPAAPPSAPPAPSPSAPSPAATSPGTGLPGAASSDPALAGAASPDPALADEVSRALDRVLGRR